MGQMTNTVKAMGNELAKVGAGVSHGVSNVACASLRQTTGMKRLTVNAADNFGEGSRGCPIISECKDVGHGIVQADYKKAALNAGILAMSASPGGSPTKLGSAAASKGLSVTAFCSSNQALRHSTTNSMPQHPQHEIF